MDTTIGLGDRNALNAVCTAFIFHAVVRSFAFDHEGDIFDAALSGLVEIQNFDFPASSFSIAAIHAEEFASEKRCLVTPSACLDSDDGIFLIYNIFRQERYLYLFQQMLFPCFKPFD